MARTFWGLTLVVLLGIGVGYSPTAAATTTEAQAHADCLGWAGFPNPSYACVKHVISADMGRWEIQSVSTHEVLTWFQYDIPPCAQRDAYQASYGSNISVCNSGCMYAPDHDSDSESVRGAGGYFANTIRGMYRPTGATCGMDIPTPPQDTGNLCGTGSCHDTAGHQYCAVDGSGAQVCVPEPTPAAPGGCISSGDTTLCAGNPPPLPPNPPVADPATDIAASDTYGHSTGGGSISTTTINNYGSTGAPPNSGANTSAGDKAPPSSDPAGSSSTGAPRDSTSASGGGDCNTPPICEGNAATCMVVKQTWLLRCPPGSQGQGSGDGGDGDTTVPGLDDVPATPGAGFMTSQSLMDKLDQGGFGGGGTCPKLLTIDIDMFDVHGDSSGLPWCDILGKVRWLLVMLAAYASFRILSEK